MFHVLLQTNTFQAVLVTDGRKSFVTFNYGVLTWPSSTTSGGNESAVSNSALCTVRAKFSD